MREVDLDRRATLESERGPPSSAAEAEERSVRKTSRAAGLAPRDPLELAELLERVDAHVRVGADADPDAAVRRPAPPAGSRRRGSPRSSGTRRSRRRLGEQVELASVGVRRVDDGRARAEAAGVGEQLDRPHAVLGEALFDLARLLVGVDVQRQALARRVAADLLEPVARARADGVGGDADAHPAARSSSTWREILGDRLLAERGEPAASVGRESSTSSIPASAAASAAARASGRPR